MKKILIAASIVFASLTSVAQKNEKVEVDFKHVKTSDIVVEFIGETNGRIYTFTEKKNFNTLPTNQKYTVNILVNEPLPCMLFFYNDIETVTNVMHSYTVNGITLRKEYGLVIHCE